MIILHSVSKTVGKGGLKETVLRDVSWQIPPRTHVVILGSRPAAASALVGIIAGMTLPTYGWVDRRATVSIPNGLLRYAVHETIRQLIIRLSRIYRVDANEVCDFVATGMETRDVLSVPARSLQPQIKQRLNIVLTYAFPCDFYIFQNSPIGVGEPKFQAFCQQALELRRRQAGIIVIASTSRVARKLAPDMMGALVYRGHMTLYDRLTDAIAVFENLPPEEDDDAIAANQPQDRSMPENGEFLL